MEAGVDSDLQISSHLLGHRLDLTWWTTDPKSSWSLVRRQGRYPVDLDSDPNLKDPYDGRRFSIAYDPPYRRIQSTFYLGEGMTPESRVHPVKVEYYCDDPDSREPFPEEPSSEKPWEIRVSYHDTATNNKKNWIKEQVVRLKRTIPETDTWQYIEKTEIYIAADQNPAACITISRNHKDNKTPDQCDLQIFPDPPVCFCFVQQLVQETTITITSEKDLDTDEEVLSFTVADTGLTGGVYYYYTLFALDEGSFFASQAVGMPTGSYGLAERLYQLLPAGHRNCDEPSVAEHGQGPLRQFLAIFGLTLDQLRSLAEGLRDRHDVHGVRAEVLPHLARYIGWDLDLKGYADLKLDELAQRRDILMAPEICKTVGTLPGLAALVNRITGQDCRLKEYVHNICLSNAPETIPFWEIWKSTSADGKNWSPPKPFTQTEDFDGHPAWSKDPEGNPWLFWHSDRGGTFDIWCQRLSPLDPKPRQLQLYPEQPSNAPLTHIQSPAVLNFKGKLWLFFQAGPPGKRDIWLADLSGDDNGQTLAEGGTVFKTGQNLTRQLGKNGRLDLEKFWENINPTAVEFDGKVWLFWQSNRRGRTEIWARVYDNNDWGPRQRVTTASSTACRHETPAAVVFKDALWLFYFEDRGSSRQIYCQKSTDGIAWRFPEDVTSGPTDASPAAVVRNDELWLFWQAQNQHGHWQIYGQTNKGGKWLDSPIQVTDHPAADKEPLALVDGTNLQVYWRSQRRGYFRRPGDVATPGYPYLSGTVDTGSEEMLAHLQTPMGFGNRVHYTYNTRQLDDPDPNKVALPTDPWCARGVVGIYLPPDVANGEIVKLIGGLIHKFLPVQVRVVFVEDLSQRLLLPVQENFFPVNFPFWEDLKDLWEFMDKYEGPREEIDEEIRWMRIRSWCPEYPDHRTVNCKEDPINKRYRT